MRVLPAILDRWRRRNRLEARINRAYPGWLARHGARDARVPADAPGISVIMPVYRTRPAWLAEAIASVRAQTYPRWELLIADDASASPDIDAILTRATAGDSRIRVQRLAVRGGISAASNAALARATQPFVTFLDHDDRLAPHALAAMAFELAEHPQTDLAFSDEDQIIGGLRAAPYFKPGWNPDLMTAQNLVCHLALYRRSLVAGLGGLRPAFDGSQDYDLALRATAATTRIRHVPDVLYHWRQSSNSHSVIATDACKNAARRAIADALGPAGTVEPDPDLPQWPRVRFAKPDVRIAIVEGVHTNPPEDAEMLVFLSPQLRAVSADWLDTLAAHAMRPGVGAAGARLDGPYGRVHHAGYNLDPRRIAISPVGRADDQDPGYRGAYHLARTVSAVSADCLAIHRATFEAAGGFTRQAEDFAAIDLCLKLATLGLRTVWAPQARLRYTTAPPAHEKGAHWMRHRWVHELHDDRYNNPNIKELGEMCHPPQTPRRYLEEPQ